MHRPLKAATDRSTLHDSLRVSVWMVTWTSCASAHVRHASIAAGVVPQSSCSLRPHAPAWMISASPSGDDVLPLPERPLFIGYLGGEV